MRILPHTSTTQICFLLTSICLLVILAVSLESSAQESELGSTTKTDNQFSASTPQDQQTAPTLPVKGDLYKLDNTHTSLVFAVSHFGISYTYGRFNEISGKFVLDSDRVTDQGFSFVVGANSIDTNNAERDEHLRGPDFFDVAEHPEISFKTTNVEKKADGTVHVEGNFTMLGVTQKVMMPMKLVGIGKGPFGKQRAGYFTKFVIKRSEFGMSKLAGQIGDNIAVTFSFEGIRE